MSNVLNKFEQAGTGNDNKLIVGGSMETLGKQNLKKVYLTCSFEDISTSSSIDIASPVDGTITLIQTCINSAITVSDATILSRINGAVITNGIILITAAGSAPGQVNSTIPEGDNTIALGDNIRFSSNGASTDIAKGIVTIEITLS